MDDFGELSCTSSPQVRCLTYGLCSDHKATHHQIEIGGSVRFSRNKQLICCHAHMVSLSRVRKPRPLFRNKVNSTPLTPSGITSYCQRWWTRSVTLRSLLVANEVFYYWTSGPFVNWWMQWDSNPYWGFHPSTYRRLLAYSVSCTHWNWWSIWELNPCHLNAIEKFYLCH